MKKNIRNIIHIKNFVNNQKHIKFVLKEKY